MGNRVLDVDPRLVALCERQGGVFTAGQARELGVGPDEVQSLRKRRLLVSVRRGVYAFRAVYEGLDPIERTRVDVAGLGLVLVEPAVFSHATAAVLQDLELLDPDLRRLHVTRADLAGSREEAGVHHHAAALPDHHVRRVSGRTVTTAARTVLDVAREVGRLEQAVAAADSALRVGVPRAELQEVLDLCRTWPGARLASRAVPLGDGRAANPGESWSRVLLVTHGLPPTHLQLPLYDADGHVGTVDFAWSDAGVVGEFDGRLKYRVAPGAEPEEAGRVVFLEKQREDRIRELGYEVVRWVYADLFVPERLVARVGAALARGVRRRRPAS
jgi:hypothetical protein